MAEIVYGEDQIPVWKFLAIIHRYTERVAIRVVGDEMSIKDRVRGDPWLTRNAFGSDEETQRVLNYFADAPVWNVHTMWFECDPFYSPRDYKGDLICAGIVGNVHYRDVRTGLLREKEERKIEQRRQYQKKRREEKKNGN